MISFVWRIAPRPASQVPTAETPQIYATLVRREAASIRPVDSGSLAGTEARACPPRELVRIEPHDDNLTPNEELAAIKR